MTPIADAVLLDARQDVASALAKVERSGFKRVAVRRTEGLVVFWYAFDTPYVLARLRACDGKASVKQALDLHEYAAAPAQDMGAVGAAPVSTDTVILDGPRFVGVRPADALSDPELQDLPDMETPTVGETATPRPRISPESPRNATISGRLRDFGRRLRTFRAGPSEDDSSDEFVSPIPRRVELPAGGTQTGTPPSPEAAAAFTAYPRLDAPATVSPRERFTITIGLGSQRQAGTSGGPFTIDLPSTVKRFTLDVLVVADGFDMPEGGRHGLQVDRAMPSKGSIAVPLVAPEVVDDVLLTTIRVIYFFEHVPCGTAARKIGVIPTGSQPFSNAYGSGELWTSGGPPDGPVTIRPGILGADLTVTISKADGDPVSGQFVWTFESPHAVALPTTSLPRNLGTDARAFATHIIEGIQNSEALDMVELEIGGLSKDIADRMPAEFGPLLREVAKAVNAATPGRPPTVLFLTAEAHVPWELALLDPPIDAGTPPYLGCQTDMGRWPLSDSGTPSLPPTTSIDVHQLAVVVGDYAARSQWRKLQNAEQEGNTIVSRYGAIKLIAAPPEIKQLLTAKLPTTGGAGGAESVHFACHGEATQGHVLDAAIILGDGQRMSPTWLANAPLGKQHHPFLFLNACQVGTAGEVLGSFSGFAGESLKGGFSGFLAPLWSVNDGLAHDIALEFYNRAFGTGGTPPAPVGSVLRDVRRRFAPDTEKNSATRLAYVFYGHPGLILRLIH